jgi:hypothetical protein
MLKLSKKVGAVQLKSIMRADTSSVAVRVVGGWTTEMAVAKSISPPLLEPGPEGKSPPGPEGKSPPGPEGKSPPGPEVKNPPGPEGKSPPGPVVKSPPGPKRTLPVAPTWPGSVFAQSLYPRKLVP